MITSSGGTRLEISQGETDGSELLEANNQLEKTVGLRRTREID